MIKNKNKIIASKNLSTTDLFKKFPFHGSEINYRAAEHSLLPGSVKTDTYIDIWH